MEISGNAFSAGLAGVQTGQRRAEQAGSDIASATAGTASSDALTDHLVDLRRGQHEVEAGAKVIQAADETLGTLIDIRA
jgi:flagellar hook protein FlgE